MIECHSLFRMLMAPHERKPVSALLGGSFGDFCESSITLLLRERAANHLRIFLSFLLLFVLRLVPPKGLLFLVQFVRMQGRT